MTDPTELVAWLRAVAPYRKPGCSYGPAFNMDGICLNDLNAKINEAATHLTTQAAQIAALTERVRVLMEYLGEQAAFAQTRIQDGIEMGATVWRIALEDIARENHTALKGSDHDD